MLINKVYEYVIKDNTTGEIISTNSMSTAIRIIKETMADCHKFEVDYKSKEVFVEEDDSPRLVVDADGIYHYE